MPRGQPDYGITTQTPVASGISDPGEAAARLGSINVYDRRGWTVWMDDFEGPALKWDPLAFLGGNAPVLSTLLAWMGNQSCYLSFPAVAGAGSGISRYLSLTRLGRVGVEFWVNLWAGAANYLQITVNVFDGTNLTQAQLLLDSAARTATIVTPGGNVIVANNCFPNILTTLLVPVKLVVDMDSDMYTRLMIGPEEVDISAHALVPIGATTNRYLLVDFYLINGGGGAGYAYVDNFILTQNEP